jgi:hypothetical protein
MRIRFSFRSSARARKSSAQRKLKDDVSSDKQIEMPERAAIAGEE